METKTSFKMEDFVLGKKFYRFIDEDHYEIYVVVHIYTNDDKIVLCKIPQEETDDIVYTIDQFNRMGFIELIPEYSDDVLITLHKLCADFVIYPRETRNNFKIIFSKVLSYILMDGGIDKELPNIDCDFSIWDLCQHGYSQYIGSLSNLLYGNDNNSMSFKDDECCLIDYFKKTFSIYIESYEVFEYNDLINLSNIKMDYEIIYATEDDKFYIVVYREMDNVYRLSHLYNTDPEVRDTMDSILGSKR